MSTLFQRNRLSVLEQVKKIVYVGHRCYIPMKHQFQNMKDQFNGKIERHPSLHLTGHEVYEMVNDVHVVLGKRKMTGKNIKEDDMWKKQPIFLGAIILKRLRRLSFNRCDARQEEYVREPYQGIV
jgi:hypothetical protein